MANPDITVVIAAYNVENYIERAIRSALNQAGVGVQVIVVNDASKDKTLAVASSLNDPRVACINLSANAGPGAARNIGFAASTTPWVAVLDGDDAFQPGRLARCLATAKLNNSDIVVDNLETRREDNGQSSKMFKASEFEKMKELDLATFIRRNLLLFGGSSLGYLKPIFSIEFLRQHNLSYDPAIRIGEDYMLLAEALASGARCAVEPSAGYTYTVRKGSISHRLSVTDIERMIEGDKRLLAKHSLPGDAQKAQKWRTFSLLEALAYTRLIDALKQGKPALAAKVIATRPSAALHLWQPLWVRIQRLFK